MAPPDAMQPAAAPQPPKPAPPPLNVIQKTFRAEALARLQRAALAECGFAERLVVFWSNHFCISANKGELARMWAGSFEREAIRPHVLGRFADMLKAVEQHPAMLFFLDNQQSLGPDSRAGINRKRGLNENLAREIMELHTLGVERRLHPGRRHLARARSSPAGPLPDAQGMLGAPGSFVFNANAHEPGPQRVLGKIYEANGLAQGEAVLSISRAIPRPRNSSPPNSRATSSPTIRRPRWCAAAGHLPQDRRRSAAAGDGAGRFGRGLDRAAHQDAHRLMNIWSRLAASWRACPRIPAAISAGSTCSASRCGRRPGRTVFPTPMRPGPRPRA